MGCFPCYGDSTMKEKDKKRINNRVRNDNQNNLGNTKNQTNNNRHVYTREDLAQNSKEQKVSPLRDVKDEEAKDASQRSDVKDEDAKDESQSASSSDASPAENISGDGQPGTSFKARTFTYDELVEATGRFKEEDFLGEGGFGRVYKGFLKDTGEVVAIKQLDRNGCQGIREFVVEVLTLSMADHPNLVKLIGYCAEGDQRLLVYEYMPLGSLEDRLHDPRNNIKRLDWSTRMKIAAGAAQGLEYLHDKMKPPVIYRDLKCSNILLGEEYNPKLSDFGLAKVGPSGDKTHVSTRVMGTYGYCAPEYAMTGQLTFKSDIYSFGVVLLELITGRRAIDMTKIAAEQNLVAWVDLISLPSNDSAFSCIASPTATNFYVVEIKAKPLFKDRKKFREMADPALQGRYPTRGLYQSLAIAAMCLQEQPNLRPLIADVVTALNYLASQKFNASSPSSQRAKQEQVTKASDE